MCCGRNTLPKTYVQNQTLPNKVVPLRSAAKLATGSVATTRASVPASSFVYGGNTGLTVVSPITSKRYRFDRPGSRLEVDPRDRSWMTFIPNLKLVK